jgi:hypothetical protein
MIKLINMVIFEDINNSIFLQLQLIDWNKKIKYFYKMLNLSVSLIIYFIEVGLYLPSKLALFEHNYLWLLI